MYSYLVFIVNAEGTRAMRPMFAFGEGVGIDSAIAHSRRTLRRFVVLRQSDMAQVYASPAAELARRADFGPENI